MALDPDILGATASKDSPLVRLDQSSGLADAHVGAHVWLHEKGEVPHLAGRNSHSHSIKQGRPIYRCTS
jgi:hypothetical protein